MQVATKPWTREDELELMALVQLGVQTNEVHESHTVYLSPFHAEEGKTRACLIGAAMIGKFGSASAAYEQFKGIKDKVRITFITEREYINHFSEVLNINPNLLLRASQRHIMGVTISKQLDEMRSNCYN